ncbi:MAG: glycosyltransferase [Gemmatimonadales bacterium]
MATDAPSAPRRARAVEVTASMAIGGAQHQAVTIINRLDRSRFEPALVCFTRGPMLDRVRQDVAVVCFGEPVGLSVRGSWRAARTLGKLYGLFRRMRPDVVHTSMPSSNLLGCVAAWLAGVPRRYAHIRGSARQFSYSYVPVGKRHSHWQQRMLFIRFMAIDLVTSWFATALVAVSHETADVLRRVVRRRKVVVIHNGVDLDRFRPVSDRAALRSRLGLPVNGAVIVNVGNISFYKGQEYLVEAAPAILAAHPEAIIVIVGKGNAAYEDILRRRCRDLGVNGSVRFLGEVPDPRDILGAADVKVLCSQYEGCANVLLESMAMGLPIVATRVGGNPELVEDGVNGYIVPPEDPAVIAAAVVRLLDGPDQRAVMGAAGRARAETEFGLEVMMKRIEALYDGSVDRRR